MEHALHRLHTFEEGFLLSRASKMPNANASALRSELEKKRKVENETNGQSWTPSKKRRNMNAWWDYIRHEINNSKVIYPDFNFPKIHFMSH